MKAPASRRNSKGVRQALEGARNRTEEDGKIKGPGPFGSMALMVLRKFRDLASRAGPGFPRFLCSINGLSGTLRLGRLR